MKVLTLSDHTSAQISAAQSQRESQYQFALSAYNNAVSAIDTKKRNARIYLADAWKQRRLWLSFIRLLGVVAAHTELKPYRPIMRSAGDQENIWSAGNQGEKRVEDFLSRRLDYTWTLVSGYKNAKGEIDQILVGPNGIFAIEVKYNNGTVYCDGDRWWRDKYDKYGNSVQRNVQIADKRGRSPSRQVNEASDLLHLFLQKRFQLPRVHRAVIWAHERSRLGGLNNLSIDYTAVLHDWDLHHFLQRSTHTLTADEQAQILNAIQKDHAYYNQPRR
ncbi:MAG: nuclease-related domain-containing protein [Sulfuricurvum sp.]|nr:nuclease-related domain-containing protein [Sulfuricurvum sp.]